MPARSVAEEMHKWKQGELHSGKGGTVVPRDRQDWAVAIALSVAKKKKKRKGKK